jgi:hypothetical protein
VGNPDSNILGRAQSQPIVPVRTTTGTILVDWYTTDDPANPKNWSVGKKAFVAGQVDLYTFAVYMASSIYTSSELWVYLLIEMDSYEQANVLVEESCSILVLGILKQHWGSLCMFLDVSIIHLLFG